MLAVALLLIGLTPTPLVHAGLEACDVTVSPDSAQAGSDATFSFDVTNGSSSSIQWLKITPPGGGAFTMESGESAGWVATLVGNSVVFTGGSVPTPFDQVFSITASANAGVNGVSWLVQASDDPAGADPTTCSGDTSVHNTTPPIFISNTRLTNLTENSVTVLWDTNVPGTSQVNYGSTNTYGSNSAKDNTAVTAHSVTLTGLTPDSAYHYRSVSTAAGNTATSSDGTFLTPVHQASSSGSSSGSTSGSSTGSTTTVTNSTNTAPLSVAQQKTVASNTGQNAASIGRGIAILEAPKETTPPTISITTVVPKVVKSVPAISGVADDNDIVARIEYSIDGGKNWLPVEVSNGLGSKHATYSFTPTNLDDGNYQLIARAIDISGNIGTTNTIPVVVDKLPPSVGGNIISLGPQILSPDHNGTISSLARLNQKITVSAVGGPSTITLTALRKGAKSKPQMFTLTKSEDTGLWSGIVSFDSDGKYSLVAAAVDGAGNRTSSALNDVYVYSPGRTVDAKNNKPVASAVTIYCLEADTNRWVVWDGASYGQKNPQLTDKQGGFETILPPGSYYLEVKAEGYQPLLTSIFQTTTSSPLATVLKLKPKAGAHIGPLYSSVPALNVQRITKAQNTPDTSKTLGLNSMIGKRAPDFSLYDTSGNKIRSTDLLGKPTLLTINATWAPTTAEQLGALASLQGSSDYNVLPVALQESASKVRAYTDIADLNLRWLVDPDGTLSQSYGVRSLPTHYFIDRKGIIKQVTVGVLTKQTILTTLGGL